jgi:hypothetical protein
MAFENKMMQKIIRQAKPLIEKLLEISKHSNCPTWCDKCKAEKWIKEHGN